MVDKSAIRMKNKEEGKGLIMGMMFEPLLRAGAPCLLCVMFF